MQPLFAQNTNKTFVCRATYYHNKFENRKTASGEVFSQKLFTAAHKTLPLHTIVKVTNNRTHKSVLVKINDRCGKNGILDMSKTSANRIKLNGSENVSVEVLGKEYADIWIQQNKMIESGLLSDSTIVAFSDSLIAEKKEKANYDYCIRVTTVEGKDAALAIMENLNLIYGEKAYIEKVYNEDFFYVNMGPFRTQNETISLIEKLKKKYPYAHLIKNNLPK